MSEALTDALLRRAQSGWKDVWDAGKYAFGPEGYRDLKKNIRYYGGPHLGSTVNDVLDILPELMGPGADVRDMVQGSDALTKALMRRDGIGALEGGAQLAAGFLGIGVPGSYSGVKKALTDDNGAAQAGSNLTLYHGSPYDFDEFDLDRNISKGEGAQDLGRGLYFFDNEADALMYQNPGSRWSDAEAMERYRANGPGRTYKTHINAAKEQFLDAKALASTFPPGSMLAAMRDARIAAETDPDFADVLKEHMRVKDLISNPESHAAILADGYVGVFDKKAGGQTEFALYDPELASIVEKYGKGLEKLHSEDVPSDGRIETFR